MNKFFNEAVDELRKVVHPTRQEATQATIVVVAFMAFFAIVLSLFDIILRNVVWSIL